MFCAHAHINTSVHQCQKGPPSHLIHFLNVAKELSLQAMDLSSKKMMPRRPAWSYEISDPMHGEAGLMGSIVMPIWSKTQTVEGEERVVSS